jgi:hypothetical protein
MARQRPSTDASSLTGSPHRLLTDGKPKQQIIDELPLI